jgi:hypothetical protein
VAIQLNFINDSNDKNNSQVVIFQAAAGGGVDDLPVACQVINDCRPGHRHPLALHTAHLPTIWIAAHQQPKPGELSGVDPAAATRLSLAGLGSADIVMTGGGAQPFAFALANAVKT